MEEILVELGYEQRPGSKIVLVMAFGLLTGFFLIAGQFASALELNPVVLHAMIWCGWFFWQGYLFSLHRQHYLEADPATAYRKAFRRDILPGVALGVSQMFHPAWYGFFGTSGLAGFGWETAAAFLAMTLGLGLLFTGFRTIGFDGAGFLYEYRELRPQLKLHSIYSFIRHPLFLGGVLASVGMSLLVGGAEALTMAAMNILILPIYMRLEDARLIRVYGDHYQTYISQVGGLIPKFRAFQTNYAVETEPVGKL